MKNVPHEHQARRVATISSGGGNVKRSALRAKLKKYVSLDKVENVSGRKSRSKLVDLAKLASRSYQSGMRVERGHEQSASIVAGCGVANDATFSPNDVRARQDKRDIAAQKGIKVTQSRKQRDTKLSPFQIEVVEIILELGERAYGLTIWKELEKRYPDQHSLAQVYMTMRRFEARNILTIGDAEPSPTHAGRAVRPCELTDFGRTEYRRSLEALKLKREKRNRKRAITESGG